MGKLLGYYVIARDANGKVLYADGNRNWTSEESGAFCFTEAAALGLKEKAKEWAHAHAKTLAIPVPVFLRGNPQDKSDPSKPCIPAGYAVEVIEKYETNKELN